MIIALHPEVQADPSKRPSATRVGVAIFQPMHTGEPSLWAIWLRGDEGYLFICPSKWFKPDVYTFRYAKMHESILCGSIPDRDFARAQSLLENQLVQPQFPGYNSQHLVLGNLALLASSCSLDLVPGVADILRFKQHEPLVGCLDEAGPKKL